ncbi:MAG: hypothetical protein KUG73_01595 [Pseudomonadales bacterium]|nr:hypothetical protein [Pseudomonadales bacterium]
MNIQRIILLVCLGFIATAQSLHAATCDTVWPADLSSNHGITLDGLTFLGGSSLSHTGGTTNLSAADYHYTTANITGGDLNATGGASTRLFFNGSVSISGQADINYPGDPEDMVIFINGSLTVTGQADINAVIYVTGAVSLSGQADITGAVTALGGGSQSGQAAVVYDSDAIDLIDMGQTCSNTASYTAPALYYGGPACGSTNKVVVAFENSDDKQVLDNSSVTSTGNYQVSLVGGGSVSVSSVAYSSASNMATLTLGSNMGSLSQYQVLVSNIQDTDGRTISATSDTFRFYDNSGLVGEYYQNDLLSGTATVSFDATVDKSYSPLWWFFGWNGGPWPFSDSVDEFSIRWEGWVKPSSTGSYQFQTQSDDGVRLWADDVNGSRIIDNWTAHSQTTDTASAMSLTADTYYPIKLEYNNQESCVWIFCSQSDGEMHLRWITPSATNQVIPSGNLSTCVAAETNSLDHFRISHDDSGVTCEAELVTIEAWGTDGNLMTDYTGSITLSALTVPGVTGNGDWLTSGNEHGTLTPTGSDVGTATYTFDAADLGSVELNFKDTHVETVNINVSDSGVNESGSYDNDLVFSNVGFRFLVNDAAVDIPTQIAGKDFNVAPNENTIALQAIKTNDSTGACEAFLINSQNINMAYECVSPASCKSAPVEIGGVAIGDNGSGSVVDYNNISMDFGNAFQSKAEITVNYPDAGQIRLHAQLQLQDESGTDTTLMSGSSNAFWVRPDKLVVTATGSTGLTNTGSSGTPKHKAGDAFNLVVSAVNTAGDVTENYSPGQIQLKLTRTGPISGGDEGNLVYSSGSSLATVLFADTPIFSSVILESFTGGISTYNAATYSEVGIFALDIQDSNYGGVGINVPGDAINVGRFYPDHFDVTASDGSFDIGCGSSVYIDEPFMYLIEPTLTITAKNSIGPDGAVTKNYTGTDYQKLIAADITRTFPVADNTTDGIVSMTKMAVTTSTNDGALTGSNGVMTYAFNSSDTFTYTKNVNSQIATFVADLSISTDSITESAGDGVSAAASPLPTITPTGINILFGRWRMENVFGPETSALSMASVVEYFDGSVFLTNAADTCTDLSAKVSIDGGAVNTGYTGISVGGGTSDFSQSLLTDGGDRGFSFTAPLVGNTGTINVGVDLSTLPWLYYDWDADGDIEAHDDVTVTFGRYRAHDKIIYWREVSN